jgi:hypothetical protein
MKVKSNEIILFVNFSQLHDKLLLLLVKSSPHILKNATVLCTLISPAFGNHFPVRIAVLRLIGRWSAYTHCSTGKEFPNARFTLLLLCSNKSFPLPSGPICYLRARVLHSIVLWTSDISVNSSEMHSYVNY